MQIIQKIKQRIAERKFSKTMGERAELKDIEARAYNEEMRKQLRMRATARGKDKAHKHIKSRLRRYLFKHTA